MTPVASSIRHLQSLLHNSAEQGISTAQYRSKPWTKSKRPSLEGLRAGEQGSKKGEPLEEWQEGDVFSYRADEAEPFNSKSIVQDEVVNRILFHAGTTDEGMPMIALCPCNLPKNLKPNDQKALLDRLLLRFQFHGVAPYILIYFASPTFTTLSTTTLISRYLSLPRLARKSLSKMVIVHPGYFVKFAMKLFLNGIVSGKVSKKGKVRSVASLSDLANEVDITWQVSPPASI